MTARSNFRRSLERAFGLVELNRKLSARGRPPRELQDVLRGAVVLGLGSLDAMVADVIVQAVPSASRKGKLGKRVQGWVKSDPDAFLDLFAKADPDDVQDGADWKSNLNPNSLEALTSCRVEPSLASAEPGHRYQFERQGYFCVDSVGSSGEGLIFNRIVPLRDSWAKIEKAQQKR